MLGFVGHSSRIAVPPGGGLWPRASAWSHLGGADLRVVVFLPVVIFIAQWCLWPLSARDSLLFWFSVMLVAPSLTLMVWPRLWLPLALDSLRPLDRAGFLAEIGLAIAINIGRTWLLLAAGWLAGLFLLGDGPVDFPALAAALAASVGVQIFIFGVGVWLLRYRRRAGALAAPVIPLLMMMAVLIGYTHHPNRVWSVALGAGIVLAIAGLLIARDAWRRWLVTELG
jgi:hypothetical protein